MPYVIVYEDGQSVELRGSFDSQQGNVLFSKLGLSDRTKTAGKKKDLPDIKCEYFTLLEKSGFQLVSSNACHDTTLTGKNRVIREYIFHKFDETMTSIPSSSRGSSTAHIPEPVMNSFDVAAAAAERECTCTASSVSSLSAATGDSPQNG